MKKIGLIVFLLGVLISVFAGKLEVKVRTDKADGIYQKNEKIVFFIEVLEDGKALPNQKVRYSLHKEGFDVKQVDVVSEEKPLQVVTSASTPSGIFLKAVLLDDDNQYKTVDKKVVQDLIGVMVAPLEIKTNGVEPKDFDKFWAEQRLKLDQVPISATLEKVPADKVPAQYRDKFDVYDVKVTCFGSMPVSGYLSIPKDAKEKSLGAVVFYHGAGVRSSHMRFYHNAMTFDVNAHGIANGQPNEFYTNLSKNELANYPRVNSDDREKYHFKEMYIRVMRALDYIKTRPEWNQKDLIVVGGSQGGAQAIVAAALDNDVTLCVSEVSALSEHAGEMSNPKRYHGWPHLYKNKDGVADNPKIAECASYFDNVFFAPKIKCETYMATGFVDTVCAPSSVYAVYNNLNPNIKKNMENSPAKGHNARTAKGYARINEILK